MLFTFVVETIVTPPVQSVHSQVLSLRQDTTEIAKKATANNVIFLVFKDYGVKLNNFFHKKNFYRINLYF